MLVKNNDEIYYIEGRNKAFLCNTKRKIKSTIGFKYVEAKKIASTLDLSLSSSSFTSEQEELESHLTMALLDHIFLVNEALTNYPQATKWEESIAIPEELQRPSQIAKFKLNFERLAIKRAKKEQKVIKKKQA